MVEFFILGLVIGAATATAFTALYMLSGKTSKYVPPKDPTLRQWQNISRYDGRTRQAEDYEN
jgi:hypothetical protein